MTLYRYNETLFTFSLFTFSPLLHYPPVLHGDFPVGKVGKLFVVSDDDEGLPHLVAEVEEEAVQFLFVVSVEGTAGFIGKDDIGLIDEGAASHRLKARLACARRGRRVP